MIKNIIGLEGKYVITDSGDNEKTIFSISRNDYLKPSTCSNGRLKVQLNGSQCFLHKLIAEAFIPNPNNYGEIHHKDGNPLNNKIENLEWIDAREHDKLHADERGKEVFQYTQDGTLFKIWKSVSECGRNGYNKGHVAACCRGEQNTHKGFKFSYKRI